MGEKTVFVGKTGRDEFGRLYREDLEKHGVNPTLFSDEKQATGMALTMSSPHERSFVVHHGANAFLTVKEVESTSELLAASRFFYFTGFALTNRPQKDAVIRAAEIAKSSGCTVVFDPGSHNLVRQSLSVFKRLLGLTDVLSTNLEEARALTGQRSIAKIGACLKNTVPFVALRLGPEGALLIRGERTVAAPPVDVAVVDPTGAGDAFTAALIHGLKIELSPENLGLFANWFAAQKVRNYGARSFATAEETKTYLKKLKGGD
jgi:sugar/nucleoside kinase (ribokinase family)